MPTPGVHKKIQTDAKNARLIWVVHRAEMLNDYLKRLFLLAESPTACRRAVIVLAKDKRNEGPNRRGPDMVMGDQIT